MDTKEPISKGEFILTIQELKKRYVAITKLKRGGQKIVYKAQTANNKCVALKIISNVADSRVLQEINIVKKYAIPHIPKILENGIVKDDTIGEDALYIIEEFIDGISLRDWISSGNTFNLTSAYNTLFTLLEIEIQLEKNNIIHRDINPNNIILSKSGDIYLIDFGLAKILDETSLTKTAALHGPYTPGYAPHEQYANIKFAQDVRTDLFQIGVTIYEACLGKNPFIEKYETAVDIMDKTLTMVPPNLVLNGDNSGMFAQFINMLMAKNQSQRPATATDAMRYLISIKSYLVFEEE